MHRKYPVEKLVAALRATHGNVSASARQLSCHPATIQAAANCSPTGAAAIAAGREEPVDLAEQRLREAVDQGEAWAVALTLKALGKRRGYTERTELAGADDAPIVFTLNIDPPDAVEQALERKSWQENPIPGSVSTSN